MSTNLPAYISKKLPFFSPLCYIVCISKIKIHMLINIKNQKEEKRATLIRAIWVKKDTRALILSYIEDHKIRDFLLRATEAIWVKLLLTSDDLAIEGADAFISDRVTQEIPLDTLLHNWVVPILPSESAPKKLSEFNPMKFEWNSFLFEEVNEFQMFASLIRFLENIRYPGDKRTLLNNVIETK